MRRRTQSAAALFGLLLACLACVSKPALSLQIFSIDPPPIRAKRVEPGAHVVSIDRVVVAPEFAGRALTYRTGAHSFERDPYAVLAAAPRDLVFELLRANLQNANFVQEVVDPGGLQEPDISVEAYVSDLEGDFTVPDKPVASVAVQFQVLSLPDGTQGVVVLMRKPYVRQQPLPEKTATAVADAWNQSLTSIVEEFLVDMRASLPPPPAGKAR